MPFALAAIPAGVCLTMMTSAATAAPPRDLAEALRPILARHKLPALAGAIVTRDSGVVAAGAVGVRKRGDATPVQVSDRFHLGSCTKAMTATLVGLLVDEGKLKWSSTPAQVWPELAAAMHPELRDVTVDQLLCHRSGLSAESWPTGQTFLTLHALPGTAREQRLAYVKMVLAEAPVGPAGKDFLYANRNFAVAGAMAEAAADLSWEDLMRKRIFGPLRMGSAGFGAPGSPRKVDQPWAHTAGGTPVPPGRLADNPPVIGPGGTVHASITDWGKFVHAHLRGKLAKPATMARLHRPPVEGWDYAFGWGLATRSWGGNVLSHSGSNNANYCVVWMAPERGFAVLAATNQGGDEAARACDEVASALIEEHLRRAPDASP